MVAMVALRLAEVMEFKPEWQLAIVRFALLHDAEEAWTGDIASPVKRYLDRDKLPTGAFLGKWVDHITICPPEAQNLVKIADLACDILYLLDHGRSRHAVMVRDEIHARLIDHMGECGYAPGDHDAIWRVLMDLFTREETYIDDYL